MLRYRLPQSEAAHGRRKIAYGVLGTVAAGAAFVATAAESHPDTQGEAQHANTTTVNYEQNRERARQIEITENGSTAEIPVHVTQPGPADIPNIESGSK